MHVTNINVVNVTNVTDVNRQNVTVVSQADFAAARPVAAARIRLSPAQIQSAQVLGTAPQVVPGRASVAIGESRPAPQVSARAVVTRSPPPAQLRPRQPAAVVNRPAPTPAQNPADRMNSRPPNVQTRPMQPAPQPQPAAVQRAPMAPAPANRPAPTKQTKKGKPEEKDEKR
jgi:hypothetical protein